MTARAPGLRGVTGAVLALLVALGLIVGGCQADGQDGPGDEPGGAEVAGDLETVRDRFRADLQEAEQLLQPARFQLKEGAGAAEIPLTCDLPDGNVGNSYLFDVRESPGRVDDPEAKANMVADHWRDKGYEVEVRTVAGFDVIAESPEGGALTFHAGESGMNLSGETPCVPES